MEPIGVMEDAMVGTEHVMETIIRYGLYAGAIFQGFCIGACLFMQNDDKDANKVCVSSFIKYNKSS